MPRYWIVTDTHFGHEEMMEYCSRPKDFENIILHNIKKCWQPQDILIHLGDICIGNDKKWLSKLNLFKSISKKIWLIKGNHDSKSVGFYMDRLFDFVGESISINRFGKKILLSHSPQKDTGYDINIHGHFHNSDHRRHEPELVAIKNDKQFLVAMEYNSYMPYNLKTIVEKFEKGKRQ